MVRGRWRVIIMVTEINKELAAIKLMDDSLKAVDKQFNVGNLSNEEYLRAKALVISDCIGCEFEVAMMMATCL